MTDQQRADFEAQGYLLLNLDDNDLTQLQVHFDQSKDRLDDLPNQNDTFIYLAEHPGVFPNIHAILSDHVQLRSMTGLMLQPNSQGKGWHREVAGLLGIKHDLSTVCVQVFIHLDNTPNDGARFMVVPGSHRFNPDLSFPDITYIEDMPHAIKLPTQAGAVSILHGNLWQARTQNRSDTSQRFINLTYTLCWMRHALPELSPHAIETISTSPNLCQLFDVRDVSNASGYWHGQLQGYPPSDGLPNRKFAEFTVVGKGNEPNKKRSER